MTTSTGDSNTFHADQEHSGLRALIVFLLVTFLWLFFGLTRMVVNAWGSPAVKEFITAVSCTSSLFISLGAAWGLEQWLKKVWHSGRSITMAGGEIRVKDKKQADLIVDLTQNFTHLNWYFNLKGFQESGRERRLPRKWVCLACQVQQEEGRFSVFAYVPPATAQTWTAVKANQFRHLDPTVLKSADGRKKVSSLRNSLPTEVMTGRDGRHWLAEQRRWQKGFELSPADFETFMRHLLTFSKT